MQVKQVDFSHFLSLLSLFSLLSPASADGQSPRDTRPAIPAGKPHQAVPTKSPTSCASTPCPVPSPRPHLSHVQAPPARRARPYRPARPSAAPSPSPLPCSTPPSLSFASRGSSLAPPSHSRSQGQARARQFSENRRRLHHRHCRCLSSVNPHFRHPSAQIDPQNRFLVPPKSSKAPSPTPPATRAARIGATAAAQGQLHRPPPSRLPPASPPPSNRVGVSSWCLATPSPSPPYFGPDRPPPSSSSIQGRGCKPPISSRAWMQASYIKSRKIISMPRKT